MESIIALILATALLAIIPGPNVALIVSSSLRYGIQIGLATVAGTTLGTTMQLIFVVFGLATIIELASDLFIYLKWAGAIYLIFLGIKAWMEPSEDLTQITAQNKYSKKLFLRSMALAVVNPKPLIFAAAFLPQFINSDTNQASLQLIYVSLIYIATLGTVDCLWALFASSARPVLSKFTKLRNRLTGGFLAAAGIGLALANKN